MKCFLPFTFVLLLMLSPIGHANAEEMTFCAENKTQPPLVIGDSDLFNDDFPGISVEIVNQAAKIIGMRATFIRTPWKRCLATLKRGKVDGVFNGSFKEERLEMGQYPFKNGMVNPDQRIATISYSLYRLKGSNLDWDGRTITNANGWLGAPAGYSIISDLKKMDVKIDESENTSQIFKKLKFGRIVGVAAQTITGDAILASGQHPEIEKITPPLVTKPYYVLLSHQFVKKYPEKSKQFWQAVAKLRMAETEKLAKKYIN